MRWFVDVSSVGAAAEKQRYCVEADSWQRALQATRSLRNDPGPMTGFSIELLDDGFSAVDPIKRQRYAIRKAPAEEPVTTLPNPAPTAMTIPPPAPEEAAPAEAPPSAPEPPRSRPPSRPPAPELKLSAKGEGRSRGSTPAPPRTAPQPVIAKATATPSIPSLEVLAKREQDPDGSKPLTYREYAFLVEGTPDRMERERLLRQQLARVQGIIEAAGPGKLVNLALFNVRFTGRPPVAPLATLAWKDWRGDPIVSFPDPAAGYAPPPSARLSAEPAVVAPAAVIAPAPIIAPAPVVDAPSVAAPPAPRAPSAITDTGPVEAPATTLVASARRSDRPGPISTRTANAKGRLRGDELIADLFESMHDLQFLHDSIDGADFCLTLALEKMPARGGIVHLYDIDRREYVITCAGGVGGESLLLTRAAESDPMISMAMRKRRSLVFADATTSIEVRSTERYTALGGAQSLVVAPVALGGRFLGAIELLNPIDEVPFTDDDGHALSYIAEQLATFVGSRGIILDRDQPAGRLAGSR
jgi:hypothetical protein